MSSAAEFAKSSLSSKRARDEDLASAHRTLATLCRAGVPLGAALTAVDAAAETPKVRDALAAVARDVDSGVPLHDAYARQGDALPAFHVALLRAGQESGDMPGALDACAEHAELTARVDRRLRQATAYPLLAAGVTLVVGIGLLVFVAPRFDELNQELSGVLEVATKQPRDSSRVFGLESLTFAPAALLALVVLVVVFALVVARFRRPLESGVSTRVVMRIPVIGRLRVLRALSTHASALAALLDRRLPLPEALSLAAAAVDDRDVRTRALAAAQSAEDGAGLADSLQSNRLLTPSLGWLVASAEETGDGVAAAVHDVARIHAERLGRASERLARVITPAFEVVIGLTVFALAYSFVIPLFRMSSRILGGNY